MSHASLISVEPEQRRPGLAWRKGSASAGETRRPQDGGAGVLWKVLAQKGDGGPNQSSAWPGGTAHGARAERVREAQGLSHCEGNLGAQPPAPHLDPGSPPWLEAWEPKLSPEPSSGGAPHFSGCRPGEPKAGLRPLAVCDAGPRGADWREENLDLQGRRAVTVTPGLESAGRCRVLGRAPPGRT